MLRKIQESAREFNDKMNPYTRMIILSSGLKVESAFPTSEIVAPQQTNYYSPPCWVGAEHPNNFFYQGVIGRKEDIPRIELGGKYLICDDHISEGETMEIAAIRLLERGILVENIWIFALDESFEKYTREKSGIVLGSLREFYEDLKTKNRLKRLLKKAWHKFEQPSLDSFLRS